MCMVFFISAALGLMKQKGAEKITFGWHKRCVRTINRLLSHSWNASFWHLKWYTRHSCFFAISHFSYCSKRCFFSACRFSLSLFSTIFSQFCGSSSYTFFYPSLFFPVSLHLNVIFILAEMIFFSFQAIWCRALGAKAHIETISLVIFHHINLRNDNEPFFALTLSFHSQAFWPTFCTPKHS